MNLFEILEDNDKLDSEFIQLKLLPSVFNLCKMKALSLTNAPTLSTQKHPKNHIFEYGNNDIVLHADGADDANKDSKMLDMYIREWHSLSLSIINLIKHPFGSSSTALFFIKLSSDMDVHNDDDDYEDDENDEDGDVDERDVNKKDDSVRDNNDENNKSENVNGNSAADSTDVTARG